MQPYDVVIAGGGFSGLACAQAAAIRGARVVVLDRNAKPGEKLHTTGLLVKEVADEFEFPETSVRRIERVRLYSPNLNFLDLHSPGYYFLATDTSKVLGFLAQQAKASGAQIQWGSALRSLSPTKPGWRINDALQSRYVVGCDGAKSRVARLLNLGSNQSWLFGIESEFLNVRGLDPDCLHVLIDPILAPGYIGWVIPGCGFTQVGLAARYPHKPDLTLFLRKLSGLFDFSKAQVVETRAGFIPCGGAVHPLSIPGALLLGDAAGIVSPLTAGGIFPALKLGTAAGGVIAEHLLQAGPDPGMWLKKVIPSYLFKRGLRKVYDLCPPSSTQVDKLLRWRLFRSLAQVIFYHHRGLLTFKAWRDLLSLTLRSEGSGKIK